MRSELSDNRGRVAWHRLRKDHSEAYVRTALGGPIVFITAPARYGLAIEPDGRVAVRGMGGLVATSRPTMITVAQRQALVDLGITELHSSISTDGAISP